MAYFCTLSLDQTGAIFYILFAQGHLVEQNTLQIQSQWRTSLRMPAISPLRMPRAERCIIFSMWILIRLHVHSAHPMSSTLICGPMTFQRNFFDYCVSRDLGAFASTLRKDPFCSPFLSDRCLYEWRIIILFLLPSRKSDDNGGNYNKVFNISSCLSSSWKVLEGGGKTHYPLRNKAPNYLFFFFWEAEGSGFSLAAEYFAGVSVRPGPDISSDVPLVKLCFGTGFYRWRNKFIFWHISINLLSVAELWNDWANDCLDKKY